MKVDDKVKLKKFSDLPEHIRRDMIRFDKALYAGYEGQELTVKDLTITLENTDSVMVALKETTLWLPTEAFNTIDNPQFRSSSIDRIDPIDPIDPTEKEGQKMKNEIKAKMKTIRTKVATGRDLTKNEFSLITIAANALLKEIKDIDMIANTWDIKFQEAFQNLFDINGDVIPKSYFQLASCGTKYRHYTSFNWVGEEIQKMMIQDDGVPVGTKTLYTSNTLVITVNLETRSLVLMRNIRRGKSDAIVDKKIHLYKYELDRFTKGENFFGDALIEAS